MILRSNASNVKALRSILLAGWFPTALVAGTPMAPVSRLSDPERQQVLSVRQMIDGQMAAMAQASGPAAEVASTRDITVPKPSGVIRCRIYQPKKVTANGTILMIHGGGFVAGSVDSHDRMARELCASAGARLLSVDYTRAPEAMYPTQLDELRLVLRWLQKAGKQSGLRSRPLALCGDSAGANLTAVLARESLDGSVVLTALINPVVDFTLSTVKDPQTRGFSELMIQAYVPAGTEVRDPGLSPLLHPVPAKHPATFFAIGDKDPWRTEQDQYADKLRAAGVKVEVFRAKTGHLGPEGAVASPDALPTLRAASQAIRRAFGAEK